MFDVIDEPLLVLGHEEEIIFLLDLVHWSGAVRTGALGDILLVRTLARRAVKATI